MAATSAQQAPSVVRQLAPLKQEAYDFRAAGVSEVFKQMVTNNRWSRFFRETEEADEGEGEKAAIKVVAVSSEESVVPSTTGLAGAIVAAYSYHRRLVLRADDVWGCVTLGAAQHINAHAEEYRRVFVAHQGKKEVDVCVDDIVAKGKDVLWPESVSRLVDKMQTMLAAPEAVPVFTADFSTTDKASLVASKIVLLGAMKEFFEYRNYTCCGIPEVELLGSLDDWTRLGAKIAAMGTLLTDSRVSPQTAALAATWVKGLSVVAEGLLNTFKGNVDTDWWGHIIDKHSTHGSGARTTYNGWFRNLFFYSTRGDVLPDHSHRIQLADLPLSLFQAPFTFDMAPMALFAGTVGFQVREDGAVVPVTAWAVASL